LFLLIQVKELLARDCYKNIIKTKVLPMSQRAGPKISNMSPWGEIQ